MKNGTLIRTMAMLFALLMLLSVVGCSKGVDTTTNGDAGVSNTTGENKQPSGNQNGDVNQPDDNTKPSETDTPTNGDEEPELYVVSGVWKFNEKLTFPQLTAENSAWDWFVSLNFTTNEKRYDGEIHVASWLYLEETTCFILAYHATGEFEEDNAYEVFDCVPARWTDEGYRTIDFGTYPQEVKREFYEWFIDNAQQVSAQ